MNPAVPINNEDQQNDYRREAASAADQRTIL
jgi:hypothetical protein